MKSSKAFWAAFWGGVAAPGMLFAADCPKIQRVETARTSATDSMRGDWVRIGGDFARVIDREKAATK